MWLLAVAYGLIQRTARWVESSYSRVFFLRKNYNENQHLEPEHLKYTPLEKEHYHPVSSKTSFIFWEGVPDILVLGSVL